MILVIIILIFILVKFLKHKEFEKRRFDRRTYYREVYLKSEAWKRKRYVVLRRDNWKCRYCGGEANQVHHTRYAKYNIGKEPIEWLVSVCKTCHDSIHGLSGSKV